MVKIISDSTCDLSQEVLKKYDIDIIPLHIVKGDEAVSYTHLYPLILYKCGPSTSLTSVPA